jgi:hypothetical protein
LQDGFCILSISSVVYWFYYVLGAFLIAS